MTDRAVLFVDDEQQILNSLHRLLRKEPYEIAMAVGGKAGLEQLAARKFHMVVSDQRMPDMTGIEFLQQVKESYPDTIRVVLSGFAEVRTIVDAINQGEIYRFIGKPWDDEELRATLRQCLAQYDILEENRQLTEQTRRQVIELQRLNHLLEDSVEERTRSLQFSQEVLESLPLMVVGISQEQEIVLTNNLARTNLTPLHECMPGTDIDDLLPTDATSAIRDCLGGNHHPEFVFTWQDRALQARVSLLGDMDQPRGCILILEEVN